MLIEVLKRAMIGMGFGGMYILVIMTIITTQSIDITIFKIWVYTVGSLVLGLYFGIATLIFDIENWSPLKQTFLHFLLSVLVFFTTAFSANWIQFELFQFIICLGAFVIFYFFFWTGFYLYHRRIENMLNNSLPKN